MFARVRPFTPFALLALLILYFGYQALTGELGLLSWSQRSQELTTKTAELERLRAERADLETRARLLRDNDLSRDLLEERARSLLGFSDPRDYVIRTTRTTAG